MTGASRLAGRAVSVHASIRTRMLALASGLDDVVPLGRGDPDFDTPEPIVAEGVRALQEGAHHYTAPAGLPELPRGHLGEARSRQRALLRAGTDRRVQRLPGGGDHHDPEPHRRGRRGRAPVASLQRLRLHDRHGRGKRRDGPDPREGRLRAEGRRDRARPDGPHEAPRGGQPEQPDGCPDRRGRPRGDREARGRARSPRPLGRDLREDPLRRKHAPRASRRSRACTSAPSPSTASRRPSR